MKSGLLARGIAALAMLPAAALADVGEAPILVTAARTAPLEGLGGVTLTPADLTRRADPSALDALDRLAGVRAFAKGGAGGGSYLSIRGGEPNFTLVLLDGARVNDPTNSAGGAFDFTQIDPALLGGIEVYRGALSAVHGADALSGVVNLRLREPEETSATARVTGSSYGEVGGDASVGLSWGSGALLLGGGGYDSGGLTDGSKLSRAQGLGRVTQTAGPARLALTVLHADTRRRGFPEDSGGPELAVLPDQERRDSDLTLINLAAARADGKAALQPAVRLSWSRQDARADTPPIAPGVVDGVPAIVADSRFDRFEGAGELRWTQGALSLAGGGGYIAEDGTGAGFVDFGFPIPADFRIERGLAYGFGEATWTAARFRLTGGVRHDAPTTASARWTGRAAGAVTPIEGGPELSASYAEGFKLPSLYALAYPLIANPELKPERAKSYEAGLEQRFGAAARLRLSAFRTDYRDLIDFDPDRFTNVNRASVRAQGLEAEGTARLGDFLLTASLGYLDVENRDGPPLRYRPGWEGSARVDWTPSGPVSAWVAVDGLSDFFDLSVPTGQVRVDGRVTLDAGASVALGERLRVDLALRNLTDADYADSIGFPAPGIGLRAAVVAGF